MSFRVPPELKARMDEAAAASGRSVAQEIEMRLDRSFEREDLLEEALELAFSREPAGLLSTIAHAMVSAGRFGALLSLDTLDAVDDWPYDPYAYHQAACAAITVLEQVRPAGNRWKLQKSRIADPNAPEFREAGARQARRLLGAIRDRGELCADQHRNRKLEGLAARLGPMLGDDLVARIPADIGAQS